MYASESNYMNDIYLDARSPQEMAAKAEYLGVSKAEMPTPRMLMLAILAGAFIPLEAIFLCSIIQKESPVK
jgi:formate/nitrite transporter FocA (FNT family)